MTEQPQTEEQQAPGPSPESRPASPRAGATSPRPRVPRHRGLERIVLAIAHAAMPKGERLPEPGEAMLARLEDFLDRSPKLIAFAYRMLLRFMNLAAILFTLRPLTWLKPERARRYLSRWANARWFIWRMALRGALTPVKLSHYADPEVSKILGYDPPPPPKPAPPEKWHERVHSAAEHAGEKVRADVVIVGSGPGGAVMATRLAEKGLGVVIVEEGSLFLRSDFNRRPFEMMTRMYRDLGMTVALGRPGIPIPLGRTVGGTSTINSGTCFRVPERVLEEWQSQYGLPGYTKELLAPHYDELEKYLRVQPAPREVLGKVADVIGRGCDVLGYSHGPLRRNADGCEGSGVCCFGCPTDAKRSMNLSYVPRALEGGATLYTGARAERVLRKGRHATGIRCRTSSGAFDVMADAVVISCGSIYTPPLLMRNRIGSRSGALGNNLTIHPAAKVAALFEERIAGWEGVPQGYCIDQFDEEGIVFEGASVPPELGAIALPQLGAPFTKIMEAYDHLAFFGFLIEDESRGKVRPGATGGSPRISYNLGKREIGKLVRGTEILSRVFFKAGAHTVLPPVAGLEEMTKESELEKLHDPRITAADFELSAFHPLGTCRMAGRASDGVIDPGLEVWDMDRLFVADGSVFPSSLGVNPQMTIMAVSSNGAEHVAARIGGAPRLPSA